MKVTICMGSACFLKGSKEIIDALEKAVAEHNLKERVTLCGAFCMGRCGQGVNIDVDGEPFSVTPDTVNDFFNEHILAKISPESD